MGLTPSLYVRLCKNVALHVARRPLSGVAADAGSNDNGAGAGTGIGRFSAIDDHQYHPSPFRCTQRADRTGPAALRTDGEQPPPPLSGDEIAALYRTPCAVCGWRVAYVNLIQSTLGFSVGNCEVTCRTCLNGAGDWGANAFETYREHSTNARNKEWGLTEENYAEMRQAPCHYCARPVTRAMLN